MTIRLHEPNLYHTETLLQQVLGVVLRDDQRVAFLCDSGSGRDVIQRLRVMMSRRRKSLIARGKKVRKFRLHATVHPETRDGKRHDCVVMWKQVDELHSMTEDLEDMLVQPRQPNQTNGVAAHG